MDENFLYFLRSLLSTPMNMLLLLSIMQPKCSKKVLIIVMSIITLFDIGIASYCYVFNSVNILVRFDVYIFAVLILFTKPLFKDNLFQWLFSYFTVLNANIAVMVISFVISSYIPNSMYANIILRLLLFVALILVFRFIARPLYRQLLNYWSLYFCISVAIFINLTWFILKGDTNTVINMETVSLLLLILLSAVVYTSIFYSLKIISLKYNLKLEKQKAENDCEMLQLNTDEMRRRLSIMEDISGRERVLRHDRRHFDGMLFELICEDNIPEAKKLLQNQIGRELSSSKKFCENVSLNAAISYYNSVALQKGINLKAKLDIPNDCGIDSLGLSMTISNLIENSINACDKLNDGGEKLISIKGLYTGQLFFEVLNKYDGEIIFDENSYPVSKVADHGIGTRSVISFVQKNHGDISYDIFDGYFRVRINI